MNLFLKAPMKKMVKAAGNTTFSFENIWKTFGLLYNKLDLSDKNLISSIILDSFYLETFEKG